MDTTDLETSLKGDEYDARTEKYTKRSTRMYHFHVFFRVHEGDRPAPFKFIPSSLIKKKRRRKLKTRLD